MSNFRVNGSAAFQSFSPQQKLTPAASTSSPRSGESRPVRERLDSWKEIAGYLRREVRTVQLWEKNEGMPVHRHFHKRLGSVFALRSEIDAWQRQVSRLPQMAATADEQSALVTKPAAREQALIYLEPLTNSSVSAEFKGVCRSIVTSTATALGQLSPDQLSVIAMDMDKPLLREECDSLQRATEYVLRWSVAEDQNQLRLEVIFCAAGSEVALWSKIFSSDSADVAEMPAYVADQIARCLWLKIFCPSLPVGPGQKSRASREAYLKGRFFWNQRNEEGLRKAIRYFESAIQEEPQFAQPYSGLADSLTLLSFYEIVSPSEAMPSARRAALKAIELDPESAEAHASLADVLLHFDRDWTGADREYRRSLQCNPGYALGYHWYSNLLSARGQHEAAHIAIMHALEIDPISIITQVWAGVTSHLAHQFDEAIKHYKNALELDPHFIWAHMYMAQALEQKGDFKEALREFEITIRLAGGNNCVKAMKAHTHAMAGDKSSARGILRELRNASPRGCMPSYDIAATYAALGDSQHMLAWLNRACTERNMKLFTLTQDPRFDALRHRSEFQEIVGQMGLASNILPAEVLRH